MLNQSSLWACTVKIFTVVTLLKARVFFPLQSFPPLHKFCGQKQNAFKMFTNYSSIDGYLEKNIRLGWK
jgi:hypothetical protein